MKLIDFLNITLLSILLFDFSLCNQEEFHESAKIEFLSDTKLLYTYFNFTTLTPEKHFDTSHYRLFPRPIGEILKKYGVSEAHFSLTRGMWRHSQWTKADSPAPTGAQIWAWFDKDISDVDTNWKGLLSSLSGLFCASLDQISLDMSVQATTSFLPEGLQKKKLKNNSHMRYASLVREFLCTENLTPWIKQLPCSTAAGVASIIKSKQFLNSHYLSLGFHFKTVCKDKFCTQRFVQLKQDLSAVMDVRADGNNYFSLKATFGHLKPSCSLSNSSVVKFVKNQKIYDAPSDLKLEHLTYKLDLKENFARNVIIKKCIDCKDNSLSPEVEKVSFISNHCFLVEEELFGRLVCTIKNSKATNVSVSFLQVFPWFIHFKYHSLNIESNKATVKPDFIHFVPGNFRQSSHILEMLLTLTPASTTTIYMNFQKGFLKWTEHPPDANHGFYISPSVLTINSISDVYLNTLEKEHNMIFSEAILVNIPVPDFSMPYNVICFVCTVIAVGFGQLYNISSKKLMYSAKKKTPISKLSEGVKTLFAKIFKKKVVSSSEPSTCTKE